MERRGFIHTKDEVKFLVLYAMQYLDFPVSFDSVVDICTWCDDGFSYFDLHEAFLEMVKTGHIACDAERYAITPLGCDAAKIFERNLPYPVRESAQASALRVVRQLRRDAAITTTVEVKGEHDLIVRMSMDDVFSLSMNVVSRSQASMLEQRFRRDAEKIYQILLEAMILEPSKTEEA